MTATHAAFRRGAALALGAVAVLCVAWTARLTHVTDPWADRLIYATMRWYVDHPGEPPGGLMMVPGADTVYPSGLGIQGRVMGQVARAATPAVQQLLTMLSENDSAWTSPSPEPLAVVILALKALALLAMALTLTWWMAFVAVEWGFGTAALTLVVLANAFLLGGWAGSLYWVAPLSVLPFVAAWHVMRAVDDGRLRFGAMLGLAFLALVLKAATGYEHVSVVAASVAVPVVYYGARRGAPWRRTVARVGALALAGIGGVLCVLVLHMQRLAAVRGSWTTAVGAFVRRSQERTFGGAADQVPFAESIVKYATFPMSAVSRLHLDLWMVVLAATVVGAVLVWRGRRADAVARRAWAAGITVLFALLSSASWVLLAWDHMLEHHYINPVSFYAPALLTLLAVPGMLRAAAENSAGAQGASTSQGSGA
ncbi:MAG: hypothetical protein P3B98_09165 [Gemmatimonadota bacterium]|nr:hypothetical protein [Gemmatimonadota bacterium]